MNWVQRMKKKKYAMVIDTKTCVGCGNCVIGCKMENQVPDGLHRDWVVDETTGTFPNLHLEIRSERCNHCVKPPCVTVCPTGASYIQKGNNITLVHANICTGCKVCIMACPYDARFVMPEGYISKCTFCEHRVKEGLEPGCVSVCPTHCMHFGDLDDPESEVSKLLRSRKHKVLAPRAGTDPQVYYLI